MTNKTSVTRESIALAEDGTLSISEAALFLGISVRLLYELFDSEEIPTIRIGRKRVVPRAALRRYIAERLDKRNSI